jgi:hypothetical protein
MALVFYLPEERQRSVWLLTNHQVMNIQKGYNSKSQACWIDLRHLLAAEQAGKALERLI